MSAHQHAAPCKGEAASIHDRFDFRAWSRFRAVVQLGPVSKAVIFPAPGFLVVAAPSLRAAMRELRERFPDPRRAHEVAALFETGGEA